MDDDDREQKIRARAHQLWINAGQNEGHEISHWEQAISEIDKEAATDPIIGATISSFDTYKPAKPATVASVAAKGVGKPK